MGEYMAPTTLVSAKWEAASNQRVYWGGFDDISLVREKEAENLTNDRFSSSSTNHIHASMSIPNN